MQTRYPFARLVTLLCAAMIAATTVFSVRGQEISYSASFEHSKESVPVNVLVGQSRVINFDKPIGRFSVSNPDIAEAVLVAPDQVLVNGKAFGQVNFIAWEQTGGRFIVFDVFVRANLSLIDSQIRALFPKDDIRLSQANGSVVISGSVADPSTATKVQSVVEAAGFKTVNMLASPTKAAMQVQLHVRVAEVSKARMKDMNTSFGYQGAPGLGGYANGGGGPSELAFPKVNPNGSLGGGIIGGVLGGNALNLLIMGGNTLGMLRMLQTQGAMRSLAEPNIIAMDGQQASFLAGGEFPVPIVQSDGTRTMVTIVWKEYGVRLNFKPTIIDEDHIRLELEPEVSTIDFSNGVKFDGFVIPGLKTRRAKTGVELRDGQSFALAGLMDNSELRSLSKVPLLGDIPILGALFKSKSYQKNETELMFIVTAQLVKPVNRDDLPQLRGVDGLRNGSPLGVEPKGEGISGQSGFSTGTSEIAPSVAPQSPTTPANNALPSKPSAVQPASSDEGAVSKLEPVLAEEPPPMPAPLPAQAMNRVGVTP